MFADASSAPINLHCKNEIKIDEKKKKQSFCHRIDRVKLLSGLKINLEQSFFFILFFSIHSVNTFFNYQFIVMIETAGEANGNK